MARLGKVSVIGSGNYGATTALRLAEYDIFDEVVMTDIREGWAEGLALDMNESRPIEGYNTKVVGQTTANDGSGYEAIEGSRVIVVTAGVPRKPGMSRMDLLGVNAGIVHSVADNIKKYAPNAVVIVVSNPLDEMTALTQIATGFDHRKIIGQAGMLDSARFTYFVADKLGLPVQDVHTLTLGSHGDSMVPAPSQCWAKVGGVQKKLSELFSPDEVNALVERTRGGGGEVVGLLKTGSAFYAPSAAAARMARAVAEDSKVAMPVCTWLTGEYGISDVYLGVEAIMGKNGVEKVVELDLSSDEVEGLRKAAEGVKAKSADVANL